MTARLAPDQWLTQAERFGALLDEHFRIQGRTKWYEALEEMQQDLDDYLVTYNTKRPHQGRNMKGGDALCRLQERTPQGDQEGTQENGRKHCLTIGIPRGHVSGEYHHCTDGEVMLASHFSDRGLALEDIHDHGGLALHGPALTAGSLLIASS